jgi:hypothetical protein
MGGKFVGVMAGVIVLVAVITRAFPQSLYLVVPPDAITLDSEFLDCEGDGSYTVREYRTSSFRRVEGDILVGRETVLSSSFPGDPLRTAAGELLDPLLAILDPIAHRVIEPFFYRLQRAKYLRAPAMTAGDYIRNGCKPTDMGGTPMTVIGEESVLNYTTTVSRSEGGGLRFTQWFAPELDCHSLRSTTEKVLADGTFRLVGEWRVLKVAKGSGGTAAQRPNRSGTP